MNEHVKEANKKQSRLPHSVLVYYLAFSTAAVTKAV